MRQQRAQIHLEYSRLGQLLFEAGRGTAVEQAWTRRLAQAMVEKSCEYLRHYRQWMFDRGDEGMLVSYYMTATRYAWRYAHMTEKERFYRAMAYQPADRRPLHLVGPWAETLERWYREGLSRGTDPHAGLGLQPLRTINVSGNNGIWPPFERRVLREEGNERIFIDHSVSADISFADYRYFLDRLQTVLSLS